MSSAPKTPRRQELTGLRLKMNVMKEIRARKMAKTTRMVRLIVRFSAPRPDAVVSRASLSWRAYLSLL